jgi:predicted O-methyltransferase YrrM
LLNVERVLELGCGEYSTLTFLDRSVFPDVKELRSIEGDPMWAARVGAAAGTDERLKVVCMRGEARDALDGVVFRDFDLIFIDDSQTAARRSKTIRAVTERCDARNVVVIHDFEVEEYRRAARSLRHRFTFVGLNPYTGVAWTTRRVDERALKQMDRVIGEHAASIRPEDVRGWANVLSRGFVR